MPGEVELGVRRRAKIDELSDDVLLLVAEFLCVSGEEQREHVLGSWKRVCRRWYSLTRIQLWGNVWRETCDEFIRTASLRFAKALHKQGTTEQITGSSRAFRGQMRNAGVESCLELGLLPRVYPPWCKTPADVEHALYKTLRFCSFQITAARLELQCTRGAIPVIESAAVLASILHIVCAGSLYLHASIPDLSLLTPSMFCITVCWALYVASYAVYRVRLARIHSIPEEAAALWKVSAGMPKGTSSLSAGFWWSIRYLLKDARVLGALVWIKCLLLSSVLWQVETADPERRLTVNRVLVSILGPPAFAATQVAWQRSGRRVGLLAGSIVLCGICLLSLFPGLLFFGLGTWAATCLLKLHRGYYRAPRVATPLLLSLSRSLGHLVILTITFLCISWFFSLFYFLYLLVFAMACLAAWVATAVFIPLVGRCHSLDVPFPYGYVALQSLLFLVHFY